MRNGPPRTHRIDDFALQALRLLGEDESNDGALFNGKQAAFLILQKPCFMEQGRRFGFGPRSEKIGSRYRYRKSEIRRWLKERAALAEERLAEPHGNAPDAFEDIEGVDPRMRKTLMGNVAPVMKRRSPKIELFAAIVEGDSGTLIEKDSIGGRS